MSTSISLAVAANINKEKRRRILIANRKPHAHQFQVSTASRNKFLYNTKRFVNNNYH